MIAQVWVDLIDSQGNLNLSPPEKQAALEVYLGGDDAATPKYDIMASKACGSCADFVDEMKEAADPTNMAWQEYCGENAYGHEAPHSALVFHPLDPETGEPLQGIRNVGVAFQSSRISVSDAFSTHFPTNVTQRFQETLPSFVDFFTSFSDTFPLMAAASLGIVTYGPDLIGAGESEPDYDRSYITAIPYQQAAVVGYYATARYTDELTNGCTQVSNKVITWGFSAGGGAVVFGTVALEQQGLNIERLFSAAGVYNNAAILQGLVGE